MKNKVHWNEWEYCGIGDDTKEDVINKRLNDYFQDTLLYFASTRKESIEVNRSNVLERIKKELGQNELFVWDTNFKKAIEFNKIGVMRTGLVPTDI